MNEAAIRKALEQLDRSFLSFQHHGAPHPVTAAVVRVGLRACEKWEKWSKDADSPVKRFRLMRKERELEVIADILREAGVEVEE